MSLWKCGICINYNLGITTLNNLPNLESCAFVWTEHTVQKDLVNPYNAWYLAPYDGDNTMFNVLEKLGQTYELSLEEGGRKHWAAIQSRRDEIKRADDSLKIELLGINGRKREGIPPNEWARRLAPRDQDWFG